MLEFVGMSSFHDLRRRWRAAGRPAASLSFLRVLLAGLLVVAVAVMVVLPRSQALPDFTRSPAGPERKAQFVEFLQPLIAAENAGVMRDRARLISLAASGTPGWHDRRWLRSLAKAYRLEPSAFSLDELRAELLLRVDAVPMSLALAQAAKESGWGTSRFAREGRNLFGQRCYDPGCGIVPHARADEKVHQVEVFKTPRESVASYLRNINTHPVYLDFRLARARLRAERAALSGLVLADELQGYSERGGVYIKEIKHLIRFNDLDELDLDTGA